MFAAHGAAEFEGGFEHILDGTFGLHGVPGHLFVDHDVDMNIAVTGVAEVDDRNLVLLGNGIHFADHFRNFAAWDTDVFIVLVRIDIA